MLLQIALSNFNFDGTGHFFNMINFSHCTGRKRIHPSIPLSLYPSIPSHMRSISSDQERLVINQLNSMGLIINYPETRNHCRPLAMKKCDISGSISHGFGKRVGRAQLLLKDFPLNWSIDYQQQVLVPVPLVVIRSHGIVPVVVWWYRYIWNHTTRYRQQFKLRMQINWSGPPVVAGTRTCIYIRGINACAS